MNISILINNRIKRIEAFADTHGKHRQYRYNPEMTDILVCAGDVCDAGDERQLCDFFVWFAAQPVKHKLFVPGNHDLPFDIAPEYAAAKYIPDGVTFIENGGVTLGGVSFYVLPVRAWMHEPLYLPHRVDVLVTHGAPTDILDDNGRGGCPVLRKITDEAKPGIHIFGHCHKNGTQEKTVGETRFYNVAMNS